MLRRLNRQHILLLVILLAAGAGLYAGWRVFWFLTDDAYIAFRYISNSRMGFGYVWNAPPFKPVEGYTSFLWIVLLDCVWRVTGIDPPSSSNVVALIFAGGTLLLTAAMVMRVRLTAALARYRLALLALVLFGTLTNRTFLAWTSSGLETAMFNFWLTAWLFVALCWPAGGARWLATLALLAALMELTRPDGLLFLAATLLIIGLDVARRLAARTFQPARLAVLAPLLITVLHLAWRLVTYGQWLPNTYLAKYTGPWPESGVRYLLSFIIEYSYWFWLALAVVVGVILLRRLGSPAGLARRWWAEPLQPAVVQTVTIGTLAAHFAYYTFIIGGDHFEYRVYSQLVPLLLVSFVWLLNALAVRPAWTLALLSLSIAAGLPIPWTHWAASQSRTTREDTFAMELALAPYFPVPARPYVQVFDDLQVWLAHHAVGVRHQEHKVFLQYQFSTLPTREQGLLLSPVAQAIRVEGSVGAIGWVLPTVAILDTRGLNDLVIARNPPDPNAPRIMAHDRTPPEGYLDCFHANAETPLNKIIIGERADDLATLVPACENHGWPATLFSPNAPSSNQAMAPAAKQFLDNVWTKDALFIDYVPPGQAPSQSPQALVAAFQQQFHDTGCLVFAPPSAADGYEFAFLPPNLRYGPDELKAIFPWAKLVDFKRTGGPVPYNLGYALPAAGAQAPAPATAHSLSWAPADLLGYTLATPNLQPGSALEVMLYFRVNQAAGTEQWFRLSLNNPAQPGTALSLDEADPCRGLFPAPLWQAGQVILAKSIVPVPADLAPGNYALNLSMFDLAFGPDAPLEGKGDATLATLPVASQ
jgi:arabinofuranosyltransferase